MRARLTAFVTALLLLTLPVQGIAAVRMSLCAHEVSSTDAANHNHGARGSETGANLSRATGPDHAPTQGCEGKAGGGLACDDCAQCHACCASALPAAVRHLSASSQPHPIFPSPAFFAGFIPEHLDPPPLG